MTPTRFRRRPQVVLWGGRPGIDRQFGGRYDLIMVEYSRDYGALIVKLGAAIAPAMLSLEDAARGLNDLAKRSGPRIGRR